MDEEKGKKMTAVQAQDRLSWACHKLAFLRDAMTGQDMRLSDSGREGMTAILDDIRDAVTEVYNAEIVPAQEG